MNVWRSATTWRKAGVIITGSALALATAGTTLAADKAARGDSGRIPVVVRPMQPGEMPHFAGPDPQQSVSENGLTPEIVAIGNKARRVLEMYYPRHQNTRDNTPWEVMHAIIAYGVDTQLLKGGPTGEKVNAVGWTCYNYPCANQQLLFLNRGKIDAERGVGIQGHHGQFLAILAQSRVPSDYPMRVTGKDFTIRDMIDHEAETCVMGEELTFKLISLAHYYDSDATWRNRDGQEWSIQKLVREEIAAPIRGAACGGTHRLMGLSYSLRKRTQQGKPLDGEFGRASDYIQNYHKHTFGLQNPDGSFSTEWFTRRADSQDIDRRIKTSGHILEWISFSLSDSELRDPRMLKAVDYLATTLEKNDRHAWEIGPLGHALHGLAIYNSRVFKGQGPPTKWDVVEDMPSPPILQAQRPGDIVE